MQNTLPDWSFAIFAGKESAQTLNTCIRTAALACCGREAVIDVMVMGNRELALSIAGMKWGMAAEGCSVRIWSMADGDKAHAWNEYLHRIWPTGRTPLFIDGYTTVKPSALASMGERLASEPAKRGAASFIAGGRGKLLKTGGQHGNLHAIDPRGMALLRRERFELPVGQYWTNSLIGTVLMLGLEAQACARSRETMPVERRAPERIPLGGHQPARDGIGMRGPVEPVLSRRASHGARPIRRPRGAAAAWALPELVASASGRTTAAIWAR